MGKYSSQSKWQKENGYAAKSFKLKKDITEKFAKACATAGVSQAQAITKFMLEFIEKVENEQISKE